MVPSCRARTCWRASDLLDKYVGETEQRIAAMFEAAQDEGAVLLLDEADSFLSDRLGAGQAWEVTQTNEFLTQLEAFDGVFFATTNLIDRLDPAVLRRFSHKVRFDVLTAQQAIDQLFAENGVFRGPNAPIVDVDTLGQQLFVR